MNDVNELARVVVGANDRAKTSTHTATVTSVGNDGTVWVNIPGGAEETPITTSTTEAEEGDTVHVTISNGRAVMSGNVTSPSATTRSVAKVGGIAEEAMAEAQSASGKAIDAGKAAQTAIENAQAVADAIDQHFFTDTNGIHVSTEEDAPAGTRNILVNSSGILLRKQSTNLAQFTQGEVAFYDGVGNNSSNVCAVFGTSGAQIGKATQANVAIDSQYIAIKGGSSKYVEIGPENWSSGTPTGGGIIKFNNSSTQFIRGDSTGDVGIVSDDNTYLTSGIRSTSTVGDHMRANLVIAKPYYSPGDTNYAMYVERTTKTGADSTFTTDILELQYNGNLWVKGTITDGSGNVLSGKVNSSDLADMAYVSRALYFSAKVVQTE